MIALLPLLLAFGQIDAPLVAAPTDWSVLADLRYLRPPIQSPELAQYARGEIAAGRCAPPAPAADGSHVLKVEMIVHLSGGRAQRIIPRAIGCPTVEQYATGLVSRMTRGNVDPAVDGWFRTAITFTWQR